MAEEKSHKYIPAIEEIEKIKGKHRKQPTVCADQRRQYGHCGICGYNEFAAQGVDYCEKCGKEREILFLWDWWNQPEKLKCHKITHEYKHFRTGETISSQRSCVKRYMILVCLACGAVETPKCPACGKDLWKKGVKRFCKHCGYRID